MFIFTVKNMAKTIRFDYIKDVEVITSVKITTPCKIVKTDINEIKRRRFTRLTPDCKRCC